MTRRVFAPFLLLCLLAIPGAASLAAAAPAPPEGPPADLPSSRAERAHQEVLRALVAGTGPPSVRSVLSSSGFWGGYASIWAVGDLDGDGREDAAEEIFTYDDEGEHTVLSAVRSTDGSTMWTMELEGYGWAIRAGDLDGVEGDDVIVAEFAWEAVPGTYLVTSTYRALRGVDGTELWTREFRAPVTWVGAGPTSVAGDTGGGYLRALGDADGDGARDLLLVNFAAASIYDEATETYDGTGSASFHLLSGRTGAPIAVFPTTPGQGFPDAAFVPDFTGDGLDDVVVLGSGRPNESGGRVAELSGYAGVGGIPVWRTEIEVFEWPWLEGGDHDGDGAGDVRVWSVHVDEETWETKATRIDVVSGDGGAALWTTDVPGFAEAIAIGDVDGDEGADLLVMPSPWDGGGGGGDAPDVSAVRGADGSTLWSRDFRGLRSVWSAGDATGDGIRDVFVTVSPPRGERGTRQSTVVSGSTGARVWSRTLTRGMDLWPLWGDLDGDGGDDLLLFERDHGRTRHAAVGGATGRLLWGMRPGEGYVNDIMERPGGADLLESGSGGPSMFTAARSGETGLRRWTRVIDLEA